MSDQLSSGGFNVSDLTDGGRKPGDWKSVYNSAAIKQIRIDAIYVSICTLLYLISLACFLFFKDKIEVKEAFSCSNDFYYFLASFLSGGIGGCLFALKWMYHSVAKKIWHLDRRLWRIFTPHISAILALMVVIVVRSNIFNIFDKDFTNNYIGCAAIGFLVGYFSDKALAKMAELADTIFGVTKSESCENSKTDAKK